MSWINEYDHEPVKQWTEGRWTCQTCQWYIRFRFGRWQHLNKLHRPSTPRDWEMLRPMLRAKRAEIG